MDTSGLWNERPDIEFAITRAERMSGLDWNKQNVDYIWQGGVSDTKTELIVIAS